MYNHYELILNILQIAKSRSSALSLLLDGKTFPKQVCRHVQWSYKVGKFRRKCAKDFSKSNSFAMVNTTLRMKIVNKQYCTTIVIMQLIIPHRN